jgi:hypothetical protein
VTLSNRDLARLVDESVDVFTELAALVHHGVLQRMAEAAPGVSVGRFDRPLVSGGRTVADPTATAALAGVDDLAALHRSELERTLAAVRTRLRRCIDIARMYPEPRAADVADRAALARLNRMDERGCESCSRTTGPDNDPRFQPIYSRLSAPVLVDTEAGVTMWLCEWCWGAHRRWGRLPTLAELERHHAGQRVDWPADVPRPA